ncbi:microsomal triacylglycerol transfer protein isoform X2 [Arctopsyche grandis]|uniref:microsomal triacylglycerol transfer protein isoform X2 n=1 Tax=Arctopsyche grandis TaxID=121162 RepID=UPI00406D9ECC
MTASKPWHAILACCSFAIFADGAGGAVFGSAGYAGMGAPGANARVYTLRSDMLLAEAEAGAHSVGHRLAGKLHVATVWQGNEGHLLKFNLVSPKLYIKSRKAPAPEGFVEHTSFLDTMENGAFYALWNMGEISSVYIGDKESVSLANYKKGIMSLFQFQVLDMERNETDVSHFCNVHYISLSPTSIRKVKTECTAPTNTLTNVHPEKILSVVSKSSRQTDYHMNSDNTVLKSILNKELHEMKMSIKQEAGNQVRVTQELILNDKEKGNALKLKSISLKAAIQELYNEGENLKEQKLNAVKEQRICQDDCPTLTKLIKENRDTLKSSQLGTAKSATVFIKLLTAARQASVDEILKALKGVKNKEILQQLCDLIGLTQTLAAHQAAKKFLHFDSDYDIENTERYLWALSVGTHPREEVIYDLIKLSEDKNIPKKVWDTMILTVTAMANKYAQQSTSSFKHKAVVKVKNHIIHSLSNCADNDCRVTYMRALKNLKHPELMGTLVKNAENGQKTVSVAAMKALKAMPKHYWDNEVINMFQRIFYQLKKRYDSSSRTLAADMILDSRPSESIVQELVWFLTQEEKEYEVKQFLFQRLHMIADKCPKFRTMLMNIIKKNKNVNNWNVLGQRGLTTAFMRPFMSTPWVNGSLVTIQEISGGILKRGHVDVVIEANGEQKELFSLGLFAGGLSSFMGSNSNNDEGEPAEEEEATTAGMELTVQGIQIRPFTFFSGQGELMGHVWSGTASERTTAFQALILLHDHAEWITLGNGITAELKMLGTASFDLAGQVQLSIWSRVAHSLVEKSAGIAIEGLLKADTSFVKSQVDFLIAAEPKLNLVSDIDFYTDIALCMQVKQPNTSVKHNVYKVERIPGSKHRLRKTKYKNIQVPGKTYALNRKNNLMCNVIHNK